MRAVGIACGVQYRKYGEFSCISWSSVRFCVCSNLQIASSSLSTLSSSPVQ